MTASAIHSRRPAFACPAVLMPCSLRATWRAGSYDGGCDSVLSAASAVHDRMDVAVGILEPGDPDPAGQMDVPFAGSFRQVVTLEGNALGLQITHDPVESVADRPGHGGRLVRPGELRLVDEERGPAGLISHRAGLLVARRGEAKLAFVEFPRRIQLSDRHGRDRILAAQHCLLLSAASGASAQARFRS